MPQAGIRAHSGAVQRLVGPVDLARFDSTVKVPTEGSGRTSRHPAAAFLCARYATVPACTPPDIERVGADVGAVVIGQVASAIEPGDR